MLALVQEEQQVEQHQDLVPRDLQQVELELDQKQEVPWDQTILQIHRLVVGAAVWELEQVEEVAGRVPKELEPQGIQWVVVVVVVAVVEVEDPDSWWELQLEAVAFVAVAVVVVVEELVVIPKQVVAP